MPDPFIFPSSEHLLPFPSFLKVWWLDMECKVHSSFPFSLKKNITPHLLTFMVSDEKFPLIQIVFHYKMFSHCFQGFFLVFVCQKFDQESFWGKFLWVFHIQSLLSISGFMFLVKVGRFPAIIFSIILLTFIFFLSFWDFDNTGSCTFFPPL